MITANRARTGFTFVEVICILMVIAVGLMGVLGLMAYGLQVSAKSQGRSTGMPTAMSIALDPKPLLSGAMTPSWSYSGYAMDGTGALSSTATGFVNGYYVERTETSTDADVVAKDRTMATVLVRSAWVNVDVYDTVGGAKITSYRTRLLRQRGGP